MQLLDYTNKKPRLRRNSQRHNVVKEDFFSKLKEELLKQADSNSAPAMLDELVVFCDPDMTCLLGNDGKDLPIAFQQMKRSKEDLQNLYGLVINPCLRPAYDKLKSQAKQIKVVIYTMRCELLRYHSDSRGIKFYLQYDPRWHLNRRLYIPAQVSTEDVFKTVQNELNEEESHNFLLYLERLLAARNAVEEALGLDWESVSVVVTGTRKDVRQTARDLGLNPSASFLWDDNVELTGCPEVITVPPYLSLERNKAERLDSFLETTMPACELDQNLVDFLLEPQMEETAVIAKDPATGSTVWSLPWLPIAKDPPSPWPVLVLRQGRDSVVRVSAVTPEEADGLANGKRLLPRPSSCSGQASTARLPNYNCGDGPVWDLF